MVFKKLLVLSIALLLSGCIPLENEASKKQEKPAVPTKEVKPVQNKIHGEAYFKDKEGKVTPLAGMTVYCIKESFLSEFVAIRKKYKVQVDKISEKFKLSAPEEYTSVLSAIENTRLSIESLENRVSELKTKYEKSNEYIEKTKNGKKFVVKELIEIMNSIPGKSSIQSANLETNPDLYIVTGAVGESSFTTRMIITKESILRDMKHMKKQYLAFHEKYDIERKKEVLSELERKRVRLLEEYMKEQLTPVYTKEILAIIRSIKSNSTLTRVSIDGKFHLPSQTKYVFARNLDSGSRYYWFSPIKNEPVILHSDNTLQSRIDKNLYWLREWNPEENHLFEPYEELEEMDRNVFLNPELSINPEEYWD